MLNNYFINQLQELRTHSRNSNSRLPTAALDQTILRNRCQWRWQTLKIYAESLRCRRCGQSQEARTGTPRQSHESQNATATPHVAATKTCLLSRRH